MSTEIVATATDRAPPAKRAKVAVESQRSEPSLPVDPLSNLKVYPPKGRSGQSQYFYFPVEAETIRLTPNGLAHVARKLSSSPTGEPELSLVLQAPQELALLNSVEKQCASALNSILAGLLKDSGVDLKCSSFKMFAQPDEKYTNALVNVRVSRCKDVSTGRLLNAQDALGRHIVAFEIKVPALYLNTRTGSAGASKELVTIELGELRAVGNVNSEMKAVDLGFKDVCLQPVKSTDRGRLLIPFNLVDGQWVNLSFESSFPYNEIQYVNEDGANGTSLTLFCSPREYAVLSAFSEALRSKLRASPEYVKDLKDFQLEQLFNPLVKQRPAKEGEPPSYPYMKVTVREKSELLDMSGNKLKASELQGRYYQALHLSVTSVYVQPNSRVGFCTYLKRLVVADR